MSQIQMARIYCNECLETYDSDREMWEHVNSAHRRIASELSIFQHGGTQPHGIEDQSGASKERADLFGQLTNRARDYFNRVQNASRRYEVNLKTPEQKTSDDAATPTGLPVKIPLGTRVLIVNDDNAETERLKILFTRAGFTAETAKNITDACEAAKSGRFQVVVSVPLMSDGSWRRLIDVTKHYDLRFEVILLARDFDLAESADALNDGAFDILNAAHDLPKTVQAAACASWAAYLRGAGPRQQPRPKAASPHKAA